MTPIVTDRLILMPVVPDPRCPSIPKMVGWLNDKDVVRYSEQRHKIHTIKSQMDYLNSFLFPSQLRLILTNDEIIGTISARVDNHNSVANLGILIGERQHWGKGVGSEAWKAMMDHLFELGIRKIEAGCMSNNEAMKNIFRKCHMNLEGWRDYHFVFNGEPIHMIEVGAFNAS